MSLSLEWNWYAGRARRGTVYRVELVSLRRAFQRTGAWWVQDLSVILITHVRLDLQKNVEIGRVARLEYFIRLREFCSGCIDRFWANAKIWELVKYGWIEEVLETAWTAELRINWRRSSKERRSFRKIELQWSTLEWMSELAIVWAVVESRVFLIRRRSWKWHRDYVQSQI